MKAFEFLTIVRSSDTLTIPRHVAAQLPPDQQVRVVLLVPEDHEDADWARVTGEQFLKGYEESDSLYDQLSSG